MTVETTEAQVLAAARGMLVAGLVEGSAGNVAARRPDGDVVVTPTALPYDRMELDDLVVCRADGAVVHGTRAPTTELPMHLAVLAAFPEIGAVLHCHARYATVLALTGTPVAAVVEEFVLEVGGEVGVSTYAPAGSPELGAELVRHLTDRSAVLMANHGLLAIGHDAEEALHVARLVERTAEITWAARLLGEPAALPDDVVAHFASRYRTRRHTPR